MVIKGNYFFTHLKFSVESVVTTVGDASVTDVAPSVPSPTGETPRSPPTLVRPRGGGWSNLPVLGTRGPV